MSEDDFKCEKCGKRKATIHLTDFEDGQPVQKHLCEECYRAKEDTPTLISSEIFTRLLGALTPELKEAGKKKCPDCGMSYLDFQQTFQFGCPTDYDVFSDVLDELLEDIHGAARHVGKVPEGAAQDLVAEPRIEMLNRELQRAVEEEDFEEAAELRDKIKELEKHSVGGIEE